VPSPRDRLRRLVTDILASHAISKPFSDDDTLAEVGLASVDMVALMLAVENEFKIEIPQSEITAEVFRSVSTLEAMLLRLAPAG
jgi:acyl carrier protein